MLPRLTGWRRTPGADSSYELCAVSLEGSQGIRRGKVAPPWLGESHGGVNLHDRRHTGVTASQLLTSRLNCTIITSDGTVLSSNTADSAQTAC